MGRHGAGQHCSGRKSGGASAVHEAVFIYIDHRVIVPVAAAHVGKGEFGLGFNFCEARLNLRPGGGHFKGVFAATLVDELDFAAILAGDNQFVQLIALVGLHGDGYGVALFGPLGADGDGAVFSAVHADGETAGAGASAGGAGPHHSRTCGLVVVVSIIWGKGPGVGLAALHGLVAIIPGECTRDLNTRRVLHGAGQGDGRQLHAAADLVKGRFALGISHDDAVSPGGVTVGLGVLAIPIDDKGVDAQLGGSDGLECIGGQLGVCLIVQVRSAKGGALLYCVEVGGEGCDGMVSVCALGVQGGQVTGGRSDALAGVLVHPVSLKGLQRLVISLQIEVYLIHAFLIAGNIEDDGISRFPVRTHGAEAVVGVFQLQFHPDAVGIAVRIGGGVGGQGVSLYNRSIQSSPHATFRP